MWRPASGLRLQAALSLLHAQYIDSFPTCTGTPCSPTSNAATVLAGNQISGTQKATGWAEAAWRPGTVLAGFPGELGLEWRGIARTLANDTNNAVAAGYVLANLRWSASLALGAQDSIEALARIDNLFDKAFVGSVIVNDGNSRFFEPGAPRSALVSLRWQHRW